MPYIPKTAYLSCFWTKKKNGNFLSKLPFLCDTSKLENDLADLAAAMNISAELMEKCIAENAHTALDQDDYQKRYNSLSA